MITLQHIYKNYNNTIVFQDFSYSFQEGRTYIITGESGCGKTTLLRLMMGLEEPDQGTIEGIRGRKISAVFQEDRLLGNLSVSKNIRFPLGHLSKERKQEEIENIRKDLAAIGLDVGLNRKTDELSGGMKRRVSILRALHAPYDMIFFDEASRGLDEENREKTMDLILQKTINKTVFWVTHDKRDLDDIKEYALLDLDTLTK